MAGALHRVEWHIESDWVSGTILCDEPRGAACRMFCDEGCDEQCYGDDDAHRQADQGRCLIAEWLNQDSAAEGYSGPRAPLRDGPIVAEWEGDYYVWHYAETTTPPPEWERQITHQAPPAATGADGLGLIAQERQRQVSEEGWTPEHDAEHDSDDLIRAAVCYATPEPRGYLNTGTMPRLWPWESEAWKPTPHDRVRELVKAGALIAAEIDRLLAPARPGTDGSGT